MCTNTLYKVGPWKWAHLSLDVNVHTMTKDLRCVFLSFVFSSSSFLGWCTTSTIWHVTKTAHVERNFNHFWHDVYRYIILQKKKKKKRFRRSNKTEVKIAQSHTMHNKSHYTWFWFVAKKGALICSGFTASVVSCKFVATLRWLHAPLIDLAIQR